MTQTAPSFDSRLCAVGAAAARQDPIGYGSPVGRMLAIETPTPWGDGYYDADAEGTVQQQLQALAVAYYQRLREAGEARRVYAEGAALMYGIAPDREWSDPSLRRALLITRPDGLLAQFDIAEYLFPVDSPRIVDFARAFFEAPERFDAFDAFRVDHGAHREFFVCTHGHVDICCAKFGVPLYQQARRAYPQVRAWRMTHFGGHRFAPTAWDFPSGYTWGFLDERAAADVLSRDSHPRTLVPHVRGWSGVPASVQLLDRVGLERFGWDWLRYNRAGAILESDDAGQRWSVRLDYTSPTGATGAYEGTVIVSRTFRETGCGPEHGKYDFEVLEYVLETLVPQG